MWVMHINKNNITKITYDISPTVIGIGVGIGTSKETKLAFEAFLKTNKIPLVVDADGLNILASKKSLLKLLPEYSVLTPHPKELERLIGKWSDDFDKLKISLSITSIRIFKLSTSF